MLPLFHCLSMGEKQDESGHILWHSVSVFTPLHIKVMSLLYLDREDDGIHLHRKHKVLFRKNFGRKGLFFNNWHGTLSSRWGHLAWVTNLLAVLVRDIMGNLIFHLLCRHLITCWSRCASSSCRGCLMIFPESKSTIPIWKEARIWIGPNYPKLNYIFI